MSQPSTPSPGSTDGMRWEYTLTGLTELEVTLHVPSDWVTTPQQRAVLTRFVEAQARSLELSVVHSLTGGTDPSTSTPRASTCRGPSSTMAVMDELSSWSKEPSTPSPSGTSECTPWRSTALTSLPIRSGSLTDWTLMSSTPRSTTTRPDGSLAWRSSVPSLTDRLSGSRGRSLGARMWES